MSKLGKVAIFGVVFIVIGLVIIFTILGLNNWKLEEKFEMKEFVSSIDCTSLELEFDEGTVKTQFYDGDKIKVEYPTSKHRKVEFVEYTDSDKLFVETKNKFRWLGFRSLFSKIPEMTISIPKNSVIDINYHINAGKVEIASGNYEHVIISLNAGEIKLGDINCSKFNANINTGTFTMNKLVTGKSNLIINAGNFTVKQLDCTELDSNINAGNIKFENVVSNKLTTEVNAGNFTMNNVKCDNVRIQMNAGTVNMGILGGKAEYTIRVEKPTSSCNLTNQEGSDPNKIIDIDNSVGSITINFK